MQTPNTTTTHAHAHPQQTFRSRVDWWLAAVLIATPLVLLVATLGAFLSGDRLAMAIMLVTTLGVIALLLGVAWPLAYVLDERALVIHAGRLRTRVPYSAITNVRPSRNPLSSPALSLERLRIDHGANLPLGESYGRGRGRNRGQFVLISPDDRAGFVRALHARAPQAAIDPSLQPALHDAADVAT